MYDTYDMCGYGKSGPMDTYFITLLIILLEG